MICEVQSLIKFKKLKQIKKDGVYSDLCRREIDLKFLEDFVSEICCLILNCRFKRNSKLIAANESASDGEADGFATTNETAPSRYPL